MPETLLGHAEADALIAMEKHRANDEHRDFPSLGGAIMVRPESGVAYAILNDGDHEVSASVLDALRSYDVTPIIWSKQERGSG